MLRIGLTGGIGAGKSTVSAAFADCGAVIVDGDLISREVVAPGTEGLAALVDHFGADILLPDGALDRPALAARAFRDDQQRARLNAIVHPLVARRRAEIVAAVETDAVIVEDIPLLVESGMAPLFPLVVVVHADTDVRLERLTGLRGMDEADARARISAQASEDQRRRVADVWLDNSSSAGHLVEQARDLWFQRILPFARNLGAGRPAADPVGLVPADPTWPMQAGRIRARLRTACGHRVLRVDHIGSSAVTGLDSRDIIDMQVTVTAPELADEVAADLVAAGYPRIDSITADVAPAAPGDGATFDKALWHKRFHASADPGRPTHVHIRVDGRPNQRFALLFVDWLNTNPGVRADYLEAKRGNRGAVWIADAYDRAWAWARANNWSPGPVS